MPKPIISIEQRPVGPCRVYKIAGRGQAFHDRYGLWICHCRGGGEGAPPYETPDPRYFQFYCLSHLFHGEGWFWTAEGRYATFSSGQGVLVPPGLVQDFGGNKAVYNEDTICFTGSVADRLNASGVLRPGVLHIGKVRRLLPIIEYAKDPALDSQLKANMALQNLLVELYFENRSMQQMRAQWLFQTLLDEIRNHPERRWQTDEMAAMCNLSYNHFRRLFQGYTGFLPKLYIDRFRMRCAAERLATNDETVAQIAAAFGYDDPFHFSRRFKQILGVSPTHFREQCTFRSSR